jgi:hypothetical protein
MPKAEEKQIAYCGVICTDCLAYLATRADNDEQRKKVAEQWTGEYKHDFKLEDINCDGCLTVTGRVVGYLNVCPLRKCAREKGVINCAYCADYICGDLGKFFQMVPAAKQTLDTVKKGIKAK